MAAAESIDAPEVIEKSVSEVIQESVEIVDQVSDYGFLIMDSLYLIVGGMLAIFMVHKLVSLLIYPHLKNLRMLKVVMGTLYVLILVIAVLVLLRKLGFDMTVIGRISILTVLISAVAVFFLVPFLPRLPFKTGHLVQLSGEMGVVDGISTYHTTLRKLDGTIAFIPNALLMAGKIINYHDTPERRISLELESGFDTDLDLLKARLLEIMQAEGRVLSEPSPPWVVITGVDARGAQLSAFCWVKNADWFTTRSDLWEAVLAMVRSTDGVSLSRSEQDIYLKNKVTGAVSG